MIQEKLFIHVEIAENILDKYNFSDTLKDTKKQYQVSSGEMIIG